MTFIEKILLTAIAFVVVFIVIIILNFVVTNPKIDYKIVKDISIYTLIFEIVMAMLIFILLFH